MANDRPSTYCFTCGGGYYSLGSSSHWVPHRPGCPRDPNPQTKEEQDRERAALSDLRAPMPDPHADHDCPCDGCENDRRRALVRILVRAGHRADGLHPKEDYL